MSSCELCIYAVIRAHKNSFRSMKYIFDYIFRKLSPRNLTNRYSDIMLLPIFFALFCIQTPAKGENAPCDSNGIDLIGAGSSFPAEFYQEIGSKFAINRLRHSRNVDFTFERKNSGYGKDRVTLGYPKKPPVLFAATESLLSSQQRLKNPSLRPFPVLAG